jgi:branched-chain amino acid transport system substrate-binding protein
MVKSKTQIRKKIVFPDLIQGNPEELIQSEGAEETCYSLRHGRGDFRNDFDFHHFPLDQQSLVLRFLNAQADSSRVVYVRDREDQDDLEQQPFRNLSQWSAARLSQQRYASSTRSDLGYETVDSSSRGREQAGYIMTVTLLRSVISAMTKTMLPLAVMTLIMYAALFFPHGLVKETVTVVITVALAGTVLLSSINAQLGDVGYILAVEYVFYFFFALCLFSVVEVLAAERLRVSGETPLARKVERMTRTAFLFLIATAAGAGWLISRSW